MISVFNKIIIYLVLWINTVECQDCFESGSSCIDHWQCCGGCCFSNYCVDTHRDCKDLGDLCLTHYCPAGTECKLFKPPNCNECEVQPLCVSFND